MLKLFKHAAQRHHQKAQSRHGLCPRDGWLAPGRRCRSTAHARRQSHPCPDHKRPISAPPAINHVGFAVSNIARRHADAVRTRGTRCRNGVVGARVPKWIDRNPEIILMIEPGTKNGEIRRGPCSCRVRRSLRYWSNHQYRTPSPHRCAHDWHL